MEISGYAHFLNFDFIDLYVGRSTCRSSNIADVLFWQKQAHSHEEKIKENKHQTDKRTSSVHLLLETTGSVQN